MIGRMRGLRAATVTMVAVVVLALVIGITLLPVMVAVNTRYAIAGNQLDLLQKSGAITNPVDIDALDVRLSAVAGKLAVPATASPIDYVGIIRSLASANVSLSGFSLHEGAATATLTVTGVARTREALQQFVAGLEGDARISAVDSPVSNYVKSTNSLFTITVTFK